MVETQSACFFLGYKLVISNLWILKNAGTSSLRRIRGRMPIPIRDRQRMKNRVFKLSEIDGVAGLDLAIASLSGFKTVFAAQTCSRSFMRVKALTACACDCSSGSAIERLVCNYKPSGAGETRSEFGMQGIFIPDTAASGTGSFQGWWRSSSSVDKIIRFEFFQAVFPQKKVLEYSLLRVFRGKFIDYGSGNFDRNFYSFYIGLQQDFISDSGGKAVLGGFVRAAWAPDENISAYTKYLDCGLNWFSPIPARDDDVFAVGYSIMELGSGMCKSEWLGRYDSICGATYRMRLTGAVFLLPCFQIYFNLRDAEGNTRATYVAGARVEVNFFFMDEALSMRLFLHLKNP